MTATTETALAARCKTLTAALAAHDLKGCCEGVTTDEILAARKLYEERADLYRQRTALRAK